MKPRPVASRHYRGPAPQVPGAPQPEDADPSPTEADPSSAGEAVRARRKPIPRSGNLDLTSLVGEAHSADVDPAGVHETEAPRVVLPEGLGGLAAKLGVVAVVMFGLGYFLATVLRPSAPTGREAAPVPEAPATWRPANLEILFRAATADRAGDLNSASALLTDLAVKEPTLPGLTRYLADLMVRQGNYIGADTILLAQVNAGREVAQTLYLRAFNAARQRHFEDAEHYLEASAAQDPLSADTYFQLGEVARRQGKWLDAVDHFQRALLRVRPSYGISPANIEMKLRLAQIEAGQISQVEAARAEAEKFTPLPPEWLFATAALRLQKGDLAGAAGALKQAREMMPREEFDAWIEDYFFRAHTTKPELAELRPGEAERRRREQTTWEFNLDP